MAGYNDPETGYTQGAAGALTHLGHVTDITNKFDKDATPTTGDGLVWDGTVYVPGGARYYYDVIDYGLISDSGTTNNSPLLTAMLAAIPEGSIVRFPAGGFNTYYGFGSQVTIAKPVTFESNWGRETSADAVVGAKLSPIAASSLAGSSLFFVEGSNRIKIRGLTIAGKTQTATGATVNTSTTVTLSGVTPAAWMVGCPISGTGIPVAATAPTTITAVNAGAGTVTISSAAIATGSVTVTIWSGQGIKFGVDSHLSTVTDCNVYNWAVGAYLGTGSDHISFHQSDIKGNYDNAVFGLGNENDYAFIDCDMAGGPHASVRLQGPSESVENVSFIRTHLGFSPYGIVQDTPGDGNGFASMSMIASPIEDITEQHICIVNGGNINIDSACYWEWGATPAKVAFQITGLQNYGPIDFSARLVGNDSLPNPNCPSLFSASNQNGHPARFHHVKLDGFALLIYPSTAYIEDTFDAQVLLNGSAVTTSATTHMITNGRMRVSGNLSLEEVTSKTANYTFNVAVDLWVRVTANTPTISLPNAGVVGLVAIITAEGTATANVAVTGGGTLFGPASIAAGHGATYITDASNWRCIGSY